MTYLEDTYKVDNTKPNLKGVDLVFETILNQLDNNKINYVYLGRQNYQIVWNLQKKIHQLVKENKIPDIVLFLEHENVYTFGKNSDRDFLLNSHPKAEIVQTDRGGQVTYHGPGQLIGYPIINLNNYKKSITWFMRSLEDVIIESLKDLGIKSSRKDGMPGVWVEDEKICAMGVRISRWVTMHGFALNINPDMKYFDGIIPCGIQSYGVTSLNDILKKNFSYKEIIKIIKEKFDYIFMDKF